MLEEAQRLFELLCAIALGKGTQRAKSHQRTELQIRACTDPVVQRSLSKDLFKARIGFLKERKAQNQQLHFSAGRQAWKSKKLYNVS